MICLTARTGVKSNLVMHLQCALYAVYKAEGISESVMPELNKKNQISVQERKKREDPTENKGPR